MASDIDGWADIGNVETVTDFLATNPHFHDCEIPRIELDRSGPNLLLEIEGPAGVVSKRVIPLRFCGIANLVLEEFNHQNVIFALHLTRRNEWSGASRERLRVEV
jgi:hypothetical protein